MERRRALIAVLVAINMLVATVDGFTCTDIVVGKKASKDGSVIVSHTGCAPECRVHYVPARDWPEGSQAPVYWGLQDVRKPMLEYGEIIGHIPRRATPTPTSTPATRTSTSTSSRSARAP